MDRKMVTFGFGMLPFVVLLMFPTLTLQSCYDFNTFGEKISKSGYSSCTQEYDLMYMTGFQKKKKMDSADDLRDFKMAKCCQPPEIPKGKPYTCTSADWDISFSR